VLPSKVVPLDAPEPAELNVRAFFVLLAVIPVRLLIVVLPPPLRKTLL